MIEATSHGSPGSDGADPSAVQPATRRLGGVPLLMLAIGVVLFVQALFVFS